jgi:hypothetical protein
LIRQIRATFPYDYLTTSIDHGGKTMSPYPFYYGGNLTRDKNLDHHYLSAGLITIQNTSEQILNGINQRSSIPTIS